MFYAKVTEDHAFGFPKRVQYYGFRTKRDRNYFVQRLNEQAEAHRNYRGYDVWPCMWTKYDHADALTADEFHEELPKPSEQWQSDGDRWTFYKPATLYKAPEVITA